MMKILAIVVVVVATSIAAFAQNIPVSNMAVTNLSDKLKTRIEYDKSTGIDIRRLNLDSIHVDKHKSRHTSLKDVSITRPVSP